MGNIIDSKGINDTLRNQRAVGDMVGKRDSHLNSTLMIVAGVTSAIGIIGFGAASIVSGIQSLKNQGAGRPVESCDEYNRRIAGEAIRGNNHRHRKG